MLHIHNGDSTAGTLREFGFPGEHLPFQEALIDGPTPAGLPPRDWVKIRARFLGEEYDRNLDERERDRVSQEARLERFVDHEETTLWFEHDLFCQANLIYLLTWFAQRPLGSTRLSLICIVRFPGREGFRGLGELTGEQLASLWDARKEITPAQLELAQDAWAAYCSPTPLAIQNLVASGRSELPFLRNALLLHLARFPSVENGLGRIENRALRLIASGHQTFTSLFAAFGREEPVYGLGDLQLLSCLRRLVSSSPPLLTATRLNDVAQTIPPTIRSSSSFALTETGRSVLDRTEDYVDRCGIDRWLGGVHLTRDNLWRWNSARQEISAGQRY